MKINKLLATILASISLTATFAQEAIWQQSYSLEAAGKFNDAITALDTVAANGSDAELKLLRRGWLLYYAGRFDESIREYRLAIDKNNRSIDARLGVTLPLLASKRWSEAEKAARAALDLAPNNYTGLLRMVVAQEAQQNWQEMFKTAKNMTEHYPTDVTSFIYLARSLAWMNKTAEAKAAYAAALTRYPGQVEAKAYIEKK
jgi:tetratricopeptide (TPR) repeat protein